MEELSLRDREGREAGQKPGRETRGLLAGRYIKLTAIGITGAQPNTGARSEAERHRATLKDNIPKGRRSE